MAQQVKKLITLNDLDLSAKRVLVPWQKFIFLCIAILLGISLYNDFDMTIYWVVIFFNCLFLYTNTYRFSLLLMGGKMHDRDTKEKLDYPILKDKQLPRYTILLPLFKEASIIPNLTASLKKLNYPKNKLQILLILEEEDDETPQSIDKMHLPKYFQKVIVPQSFPQTKAKACNYAMQVATGDIVCIFDAEDRPDPNQLRLVASRFKSLDDSFVCVQCRLSFYNGHENLLTSFFEIEYQILYTFLLPIATFFNFPIPLGGSSNHFKVPILRKIGGWDPYNVTEDADLGLRLAAAGYRTKMLASSTAEEAPLTLRAWIKQRSRWLKGYFHTFMIYCRYPSHLLKEFEASGLGFFIYIMGLGPFLTLTLPIAFTLTVTILLSFYNFPYYLEIILKYFTFFNLLYTILHFLFTSYVITKVVGHKYLKYKWIIFMFYFLLHMCAATVAIYKLIKEPHKWDKTTHGVTKVQN